MCSGNSPFIVSFCLYVVMCVLVIHHHCDSLFICCHVCTGGNSPANSPFIVSMCVLVYVVMCMLVIHHIIVVTFCLYVVMCVLVVIHPFVPFFYMLSCVCW